MKVAVVASLASPTCDVTSYGDQVFVADLARGLRDRGHDVMVFCREGSYLAGVPTAPVPSASGYEEVLWHVRQWAPDVVSAHAVDAYGGSLRAELPVVLALHANPRGPLSEVPANPARAPLVAFSEDSARRWRAAGAMNVRTIPHGVPEVGPARAAPDPIGVIAGRIAPEKGTDAALRAARRAGVEAVVVGEVADRAYFAREVVPLLEGAHVFRTLPRERVLALMARAAVAFAPVRDDEPFGLVAAEAQVTGCPVVGYARGALPEVVPHGRGGILVACDDEDALVDAVPMARSLDRREVRAQALERFDLERALDEHEELLAEAATGMASDRAA